MLHHGESGAGVPPLFFASFRLAPCLAREHAISAPVAGERARRGVRDGTRKGPESQTLAHLAISQYVNGQRVIVVLSKPDLVNDDERALTIELLREAGSR